MFRKLVTWLSKRYPEQLVVTLQDYTELRQELASYNVLYQNVNILASQIASLERQVKVLNDAQGFAYDVKGSFKLER